MLEPTDRTLFLDALRPPLGYKLDFAIGTTYSLDLLSLLTVPLAFAFSDWEDDEGKPTVEPLALLKAVREYSDHVALFCQAGRIAVPPKYQALYMNLEPNVFACSAPLPGGHFHPKLWVLRYAGDESVIYKVICATRNLTFDMSWDAMLVLEGELVDRRKAFAACHPLGDFVAALPKLAVRLLSEAWEERIKKMAEEVRRVKFSVPEQFDDFRFWPLGIEDHNKSPFDGDIRRLLIVSPFLDEGALKELSVSEADNILISRIDTLCKLDPKALDQFKSVYSLSAAAIVEPSEAADNDAESTGESPSDSSAGTTLPEQGLHAKVYIGDAGWNSSVWVGSANATSAGLHRNVEFLVELIGKKSGCGIDEFMAATGQHSFCQLLEPFRCNAKEFEPEDPAAMKQERLLDDVAVKLAKAQLRVVVEPADSPDEFRIKLALPSGGKLKLPAGVAVVTWPISLKRSAAVPVEAGASELAVFEKVSLKALTSFFAFEISPTDRALVPPRQFVLTLPLDGAPADRREQLLQTILQNREQVLRFLLLLLGNPEELRTAAFGDVSGDAEGSGTATGVILSKSFFESLVRALVRHPESLDSVSKVIEDLRASPNAADLLPPGLDDVWSPIWKARQEMKA